MTGLRKHKYIRRGLPGKRSRKQPRLFPYLLILAVVFMGGIWGIFGDSSLAADGDTPLVSDATDYQIKDNFDNYVQANQTLNMTTTHLTLTILRRDDTTGDAATFSWEVAQGADCIGPLAPSGENCTITARKAGTVVLHVTVTTPNHDPASTETTITKHFYCNLQVMFAIDTSDLTLFGYPKSTDTERALVLGAKNLNKEQFDAQYTNGVQLGLTFGNPDEGCQWVVGNQDVATIDETHGIIKPVGAGVTTVTVTHKTGTVIDGTATIQVYVIPHVTDNKEEKDVYTEYDPKLPTTISLANEESIYTNTIFNVDQTQSIRNKIAWVVTKDDGQGNNIKIVDSFAGLTSDLIELVPSASNSNEMVVKGIAGKYQVSFYAYGTHDPKISQNVGDGINLFEPAAFNLTILSGIADKDETLNIGDAYNFAEAYHMTQDDFDRYFSVSTPVMNDRGSASGSSAGGSSAEGYYSYDPRSVTLRALKESELRVELKVRSGAQDRVKELLGLSVDQQLPNGGVFTTIIRILDRIQLDRNSITISVGQSYQFTISKNDVYDGKVLWETSDDKKVSVTQEGLITGLAVTQKSQDVIITATLDMGEGVYRKATCSVKVEAAIQNFTLDPAGEKTMIVGDNLVVRTLIQQTVTVAPLDWVSTDTSVFTVEPSADNKTGTITAVGGGRADLMVYNTVNKEYQILHITVRVPISDIKFKSDALTCRQYEKGYNLFGDVTFLPANATDTTLKWTTSDSKVATVNKDGFVTYVGPGVALITVQPEYNPYGIMATCQLSVMGTPTALALSKQNVTMNVQEQVLVDVVFSPVNTTSKLDWKPNDKSIVSVTYDEKKQMATLTGLAPGTTDINISTTEGLVSNIKVTVRQPSASIAIQEKDVILLSGESRTLTPVMNPATATDSLVWESDDPTVATVDAKGTVTGIKPGMTYIFVTAYNGGVQSCFARVAVTVRDAVTGISLPQSEYTMEEGETITITPVIEPETAYNTNLIWTLSNTTVATIKTGKVGDPEIEVTAIGGGSAMLTATTEDGGYSASCLIIVTPLPTPTPEPSPSADPSEPTATPAYIPTKVKVIPATKTLKLGKSFYVRASVTGSTDYKNVKWTSSKKKVCTVTQSGKVKGKKVGTAYIKARAMDGSGASARCKVRVIRPVTKLTIKPGSATVLVGEIYKLKAQYKPKNATIKKVKWTTKDASIATVDSAGRVVGVAPGMVEIKAKSQDGFGKTARCYVTVKEAVEATGVTVQNNSLTVAKGKAVQSGIVAAPANTTTKIRYYSDNKKVASVDRHGKIRTKKVGQATIYGETANGKIGYCDVQVVDLNRKGIVMRQYDTAQLRVNDIDKGVTWYSKKINIATVDDNGLVTGRRKGTTIVYAVVNGVKLGCRVKVKKIK